MWVENAKERWMNFYQLYLASLVARLLGASGVETFREASEGAGMDLASYVSQLGLGAVDIEDALALLNAAMGLADHLRVSTEGGMLEVKVHKPSCRMCPGLLNGSQPTPKCPLYGLVKGFLEGQKVAALEYGCLEPEDKSEWCILCYKVRGSRAATCKGELDAARDPR